MRAGYVRYRDTEHEPFCQHWPASEGVWMFVLPLRSRRDGRSLVLCKRCARRVKALA